MTGEEHLQRGLAALQELGMDDPRVHAELQAAIDAPDIDEESRALAASALGSSYHAIGRQEEARAALALAVDLSQDPTRLANAHHELGETLFVLEREAEAEQHYRAALECDREHLFAPDTLMLLGRAVYMCSDGDEALLDEACGHGNESQVLLETDAAAQYGSFNPRSKALFDAVFLQALCKSEMERDAHRFEAVKLFEKAETIALANRTEITDTELTNVYRCWADLLRRMGLERDLELIAERAARALSS